MIDADQIWGHLQAPGALRLPKSYVEPTPVGRKRLRILPFRLPIPLFDGSERRNG